MKWIEAYATGIESVDQQHRMLFTLVDDFRAALDEGQGEHVYGRLLESLDLYTRTHFRLEEGHMDRYQCPMAQRNKDAHRGFMIILHQFQERYDTGGFDRADALHLTDTLEGWLTDHVGRIDIQLKASVERAEG